MAGHHVVYEVANKGSLGVPTLILWVMRLVFGMPALAVPLTTWQDIPQHPWILLLWPVAFFPSGVLWALRRLMSRYELRVFDDGEFEIVFPFQVVRLARTDLTSITRQRVRVQATGACRTWIHFVGPGGKILASLSPMAFDPAALQGFIGQLQQFNPDLVIHTAG